ncbi:hypothetical protein ACHQM5_006747 [Ranunculus cassubicifolius]
MRKGGGPWYSPIFRLVSSFFCMSERYVGGMEDILTDPVSAGKHFSTAHRVHLG